MKLLGKLKKEGYSSNEIQSRSVLYIDLHSEASDDHDLDHPGLPMLWQGLCTLRIGRQTLAIFFFVYTQWWCCWWRGEHPAGAGNKRWSDGCKANKGAATAKLLSLKNSQSRRMAPKNNLIKSSIIPNHPLTYPQPLPITEFTEMKSR